MQMHEDEKQSRLPDEEQYQKLFGLNILLTPVFVISSIAIVVFVLGFAYFSGNTPRRSLSIRVHGSRRTLTGFSCSASILSCYFVWWWHFPHSARCASVGKMRSLNTPTLPGWLCSFAAGVGIGLLFFGVLEPVTYFQSPPLGVEKIYDTDTAYTAGEYARHECR